MNKQILLTVDSAAPYHPGVSGVFLFIHGYDTVVMHGIADHRELFAVSLEHTHPVAIVNSEEAGAEFIKQTGTASERITRII